MMEQKNTLTFSVAPSSVSGDLDEVAWTVPQIWSHKGLTAGQSQRVVCSSLGRSVRKSIFSLLPSIVVLAEKRRMSLTSRSSGEPPFYGPFLGFPPPSSGPLAPAGP